VHPEAHALGDAQGFLVAADLVAVQQAREDFVQGVVGGPDLGVPAAVGGSLFEHDELVRRVGADEADAPVPVIGPDALRAQVGVVALFAGSRGDLRRIGVALAAFLGGPARLLGQVI